MSTTGRRGHQLGFCTVCKHRQVSTDRVVSCKLTNELANFDSECPSFTLDTPTLLERRIRQEKHIMDRYDPPVDAIEKLFTRTRSRLIKKETLNSPSYRTTRKLIFRESDQSDLIAIIGSITGIIVSFIYYIFNTDQPIALLIAFIAFLSSCFFSYKYLTYDYKVQFKITEDGLQTSTETIFWSNIMDYYLLEKHYSKNETFYTLIILTAAGHVKKVQLNHLNVGAQTIVKKINWHRKMYYHDSY
ncbi:hypothetical protein [Dokdonia sp.]|uniref:hypothetical protein n=1 Tax=Dokdonia sp. TaxID=2024995 RepID=UPI003267405F